MNALPLSAAGGPIVFLLRPLAVAAALAASGFIAGRLLTSRLRFTGAIERVVVATALGLGTLAVVALGLAAAGALRRGPVLLLLAVLHFLGRGVWRRVPSELEQAARRLRRIWRRRPILSTLAAAGAGLVLLLFLVLPLYPPTAFDALLYHLPFVRAFAATGTTPFLATLRNPIFPQLNELLMTLAFLFAGDLGAQSMMALATLLAAALTWVWARDAFPEYAVAAGTLAAAAFLGNPIVAALAGTGYIEPGLVLWVTAALYALHRFRQGAGRRWLVLAAAFVGCAAAGKYLGLFFAAAGGCIVLAGDARRSPHRAHRAHRGPRGLARRLGDGLLFALVAAAVMAPWYGRILAATGNPVFPFFPGLFGASPWQPSLTDPHPAHAWLLAEGAWLAAGGHWLRDVLRLPLDVLTGREQTGLTVPPSPAYLLLSQLLLLAAWREPRVRRLLLLAAAYAGVLVALPRDVRYLTPVLPVLSVALGGGLAELVRGARLAGLRRPTGESELAAPPAGSPRPEARPRPFFTLADTIPEAWFVSALAAALVLPGWAYGVYSLARQGWPPATEGARLAYLAKALPVFPAVQKLNSTLGSRYTLYAFYAENLAYYADGRFLGEWSGPASFLRMPSPTGDPEALFRALRSLGADHLLLLNSPEITLATATPAFRRRLHPCYHDAAARIFTLDSP